jgi:hypothetical protein
MSSTSRSLVLAHFFFLGNCVFARRLGAIPNQLYLAKRAQPQDGEVAFLELELKMIADVGLVGTSKCDYFIVIFAKQTY